MNSTLKALGIRAAAAPFAHGAIHPAGAVKLYDSYHCSRYNTNTRVLTPEMFRSVFAQVERIWVKAALRPCDVLVAHCDERRCPQIERRMASYDSLS